MKTVPLRATREGDDIALAIPQMSATAATLILDPSEGWAATISRCEGPQACSVDVPHFPAKLPVRVER